FGKSLIAALYLSIGCGCSGHILGQHHDHWLLTVRGHLERTGNVGTRVGWFNGDDRNIHSGGDRVLIDIKWPTTGGWCIAHHHDHWNAGKLGLGQSGGHIRKTGTVGGGCHGHGPGCTEICVGGGNGGNLVAHAGERELLRGQG